MNEPVIEIERYKRGNTTLIDALMQMVDQFFYDHDGVLSHTHMCAEEKAIVVLLQAEFAEEAEGGYRLLWGKLKQRQEAERTQKTWAQAVEKCITDSEVKARLLSMDDPKGQS